jgi:hypothetical protein
MNIRKRRNRENEMLIAAAMSVSQGIATNNANLMAIAVGPGRTIAANALKNYWYGEASDR